VAIGEERWCVVDLCCRIGRFGSIVFGSDEDSDEDVAEPKNQRLRLISMAGRDFS
jgi:hypothetical protein